MATARQIEANRRNAEKSTGPTTEEGKARSRGNALKHGLTGAGVVVHQDEAAAVDERLEAWRDELRPSTASEEWLARRVVVCSLRVDRCQELEMAMRAHRALRAAVCWDADRRAEVEELAAGLRRRPSLVVARLERTRHGCDWLVARWTALGATLEAGASWTDEQTALALDLLGTPPELRDGPAKFDDGSPALVVARELERLERLRSDCLIELDEAERALAEAGRPVSPDREVLRLRKYESACLREMERAKAELSASVAERAEAPPPAESVEPDPVELPEAPPAIIPPAPPAAAPPAPMGRRARRAALKAARRRR